MRFLGKILVAGCLAFLFSVGSWAQLTKGFRGKVVDMNGKPVVDAKAVMEDEANPQNHYEVKTDSSGYFVQTGLPYSDHGYKITVEAPGLPPMIKIEKPQLMTLLDLSFDPRKGVGIQGTVKDKTGKIVSGAKITIVNLGDEAHPMSVTTDGKGNYRKADLPFTDKGYKVTAEIPGEQPSTKSISVSQIASLDVSFNFGSSEEPAVAAGGSSAASEAKQLYEMADYEGALGKADEAIAKDQDPNNLKVAKLIKASALEKLDRTDDAIKAYEAYDTAYPGSVDVLGSLARLYEAKGDKAKAEAYKKEFQAKGGKVTGETYNSGVRAYQAGDFQKATDLFERAIKEDPNDADAHRELARSLVQLQKYQETIDQLKIYLKMKPNADDAATWQGAITGLEAMIQQQEADKNKKKK